MIALFDESLCSFVSAANHQILIWLCYWLCCLDTDMVQIRHRHGYGDTAKLKKHSTLDTFIYMLSLKLSTNTLSTNTKMNLIYLSNIQYVKSSDKIRFVPYFNHQNHVKDKKISFRLNIMCPTSIIRLSVSDMCRTRNTPFMRHVGAS